SGKPLSSLQGRRQAEALGTTVSIALVPSDRAVLHAAIAKRFDAMLDRGVVEELRGLRSRFDLAADMTSMRSVGYRQAWEFLEGRIDAAGLRAQGIAAPRPLAKRPRPRG